MMSTFNCILCLEDVEKTNKQILCTKCEKSCCATCFRTYMLYCRNDPLCPNPNCNYIHNVSSLRGILPQTFWNNEYRASRQIVMYNLEQMYKHATMVEVTRYNNKKADKKFADKCKSTKALIVSKQENFLVLIRNYCKTLLYGYGWETCALEIARKCWHKGLQRDVIFYNTFSDCINATAMRSNITWLENQKVFNDAIREIAKLKTILENHCADWEASRLSWKKNEDEYTPKSRYRVPCHVNGCAGICMESSSCPICLSKTCSECHQKLDDKHECNKDDLETVKEILNNSKPCPTCNEAISKVHGCDQMLCTSCHTAFNWKTGKIDKGRVHNPHYHELQRRMGSVRRELGDTICGGLPDWWDLEKKIYLPWRNVMKKHHTLVAHIRGAVFPLIVNLDHNFNTNLKSRVRYYVQEINKSQFEKILVKQEKQRTMGIELRDLLQTFVAVSEDVFRKINQKHEWSIGKGELLKNLTDHVEENELKGIFEYMIEQYQVIVRKYTSKLSLHEFLRYNGCQHSSMDKQKVEDLYVSLGDDLESEERVLRALEGIHHKIPKPQQG